MQGKMEAGCPRMELEGKEKKRKSETEIKNKTADMTGLEDAIN